MIEFSVAPDVRIPASGSVGTYVLEFRSMSNGITPFYKVGRSVNIQQRVTSLLSHFRDGEPLTGTWPLELVRHHAARSR